MNLREWWRLLTHRHAMATTLHRDLARSATARAAAEERLRDTQARLDALQQRVSVQTERRRTVQNGEQS